MPEFIGSTKKSKLKKPDNFPKLGDINFFKEINSLYKLERF